MNPLATLRTAAALLLASATLPAGEWTPLFDGKSLDGWRGDPAIWSVRDGAIIGVTTKEQPLRQNSYLVSNDSFADFEIKFKYRIHDGNSGLQYRSKLLDAEKFIVQGYQADIEAGPNYSGIVYEERGRGIMVQRGKKMEATPEGELRELASFGDSADIQAKIKQKDWNEYHVTARGNHLIHRINGVVTAELIDNQPDKRAAEGILAFQVHVGPPMKIEVKDILIRKLDPEDASGKTN